MADDEKLKKKHRLKLPRAFPEKAKFGPNKNDSKSHIWNSFFENIILGIQIFYICPHVPLDIIRVVFIFRFSNRKSQSQQKLAK